MKTKVMNTQVLLCIKGNKQNWSNFENISQISIYAVYDLQQNTAEIGRRGNFPFYGICHYVVWLSMLSMFIF